MGFVCPECGQQVRLSDRACGWCHSPLTFGALLASAWRRFRKWISRPVHLPCPACGQPVPPSAVRCPHCQAAVSFEAVLQRAAEPARKGWRQFCDNLSPGERRLIQWAYCLLSALGLWWTLAYVEQHHAEHWVRHAFLSIAFLAVFIFVFLAGWIVPKPQMVRFARLAPGPTKLGVCCNYLTLLLLLQVAVGTWRTRATILVGMLVVSWAGALLFLKVLHPKYRELVEVFFGQGPQPVDPSEPQGRTGWRR